MIYLWNSFTECTLFVFLIVKGKSNYELCQKKHGWLSSVSGAQTERLNEITIQHKSTVVLVCYYSRSV